MVTSGKRWPVIGRCGWLSRPIDLDHPSQDPREVPDRVPFFLLAPEGEAQSCPFFPVAAPSTETTGWELQGVGGAGFVEENAGKTHLTLRSP